MIDNDKVIIRLLKVIDENNELKTENARMHSMARQAITDRWDLFCLCRQAFDLMCNSEAYKGPEAPEHWVQRSNQWAEDFYKIKERPQFRVPEHD